MSDDKNLNPFQKTSIQQLPPGSSPIRAKSFKVVANDQNYAQYVSAIKAYALAGMPFEHIANAGEYIGDSVEKGEIDTALIEGWQEKMGEVAEEESKILAWQNRGDVISITHQLPTATPTSEHEIMPTSQDLTQQTQPQNTNVLEGIAVYNQQDSLNNTSTQTQSLENNPFLKAPATIKPGI